MLMIAGRTLLHPWNWFFDQFARSHPVVTTPDGLAGG